ncbi:MAG: membrane protein insertase YidC [Syntrophomonadaceae bacterium]|nr:membrane protein insertase YidC [Syntrophomonadaceae bacterium]
MYLLTGQMGLPNYGLAIIFMTITIKLVMFPLTQKQMHSMRAMQQLQPKMKYIQDKYKDNPQMMQTKTMEMYKEHGVSPFSSCLPLLIQMPIFIAFYQSLLHLEFAVVEHASFLWIPNIGERDPYFLLAVLAAASTYYQSKLSTVNTQDPTQKTMLYIMPLFMAWIAATLPAGLPLYWVTFNILGILQQLYVNRSTQLVADTGTGLQVEVEAPAVKKPEPEEKKAPVEKPVKPEVKAQQQEAGRAKGGKKKSGSTKYRKAGKKR